MERIRNQGSEYQTGLYVKHIQIIQNSGRGHEQEDRDADSDDDSYLTKEGLHRCPVLEAGQTVEPLHECLAEVPRTGPILTTHHVHPVGIGGGRLPDEVALHGPPGGVRLVVVPAVVTLLLVGSRRHQGLGVEDLGQKTHQQEHQAPALVLVEHSGACWTQLLIHIGPALTNP